MNNKSRKRKTRIVLLLDPEPYESLKTAALLRRSESVESYTLDAALQQADSDLSKARGALEFRQEKRKLSRDESTRNSAAESSTLNESILEIDCSEDAKDRVI